MSKRAVSSAALLAVAVGAGAFSLLAPGLPQAFLGLEIGCVVGAVGLALWRPRAEDAAASETPAVSAKRGWFTPLVVLVPSIATVAGTIVALILTHEPGRGLALLVIPIGLAITAKIGSRLYETRLVLATALLTLAGGFLGLAILVLFAVGAALSCETSIGGGWASLGIATGAVVYLTVGTAAFRTKHPLLGVVLALVVGLVATGVVISYAPVTQIPDCST